MTKAYLVEVICQRANITKVKAELVVETIFESIKGDLKKGQRIEIRGFGSFEVRHYGRYLGCNPKTGDVIKVPKKRLPFFKVGKELKAKVSGKRS